MNIIITNDDGIHAEGIRILAQWAKRLGHVTIVAPKTEQSGKSHGIELHQPFEAKRVDPGYGVDAYSVDSTPADCIRYALLGMHLPCDLVLSGINRGLNIGVDINYSGTVGAVFEASALGVKGVSVSTGFNSFNAAAANLDRVADYFLRHDLLGKGSLFNVNIPETVTGDIRITHQGGPYYSDSFRHEGNNMYMPIGHCVYENRNDLTLDSDAVMAGYISISPLTIDRTDRAVFQQLTGLNG